MQSFDIEKNGLGMFCLEETLEDTLNKLDKPFKDCVHPMRNTTDYSPFFDSKIMKKVVKELSEYTESLSQDLESISCKDSSSGVKCLKVKKGGNHFKPFYQNSRW